MDSEPRARESQQSTSPPHKSAQQTHTLANNGNRGEEVGVERGGGGGDTGRRFGKGVCVCVCEHGYGRAHIHATITPNTHTSRLDT